MRRDGRLFLHRPGDPIQVVGQRLVYVVAGEPSEVHLGAELKLDFIELGIAADNVVRTALEVLFEGHDLADRSLVDAPHHLSKRRHVSALESGKNADFLLLRQLRSDGDLADTHRIDGVGLLDENVLAGLDRRQQVHGVVLRRTGDQHHVNALDHVLVAVQAPEAMGFVYLHLFGLLFLSSSRRLLM